MTVREGCTNHYLSSSISGHWNCAVSLASVLPCPNDQPRECHRPLLEPDVMGSVPMASSSGSLRSCMGQFRNPHQLPQFPWPGLPPHPMLVLGDPVFPSHFARFEFMANSFLITEGEISLQSLPPSEPMDQDNAADTNRSLNCSQSRPRTTGYAYGYTIPHLPCRCVL